MRPQLIVPDIPEIRASVRVAKLAAAWDCDPCQIRRLIETGHLEAHGIGERGTRVYVDSANAYQARKSLEPKNPARKRGIAPRSAASPVDKAAYKAGLASLRRAGIAL